MFYLVFGDADATMQVCHTCDNPYCVNPEHLFLGSQLENMQDAKRKGRIADHNGENNPKARLDARHVRAMRELRKFGLTYTQLKKIFEVGKSTVANVIGGNTWRSVSSR